MSQALESLRTLTCGLCSGCPFAAKAALRSAGTSPLFKVVRSLVANGDNVNKSCLEPAKALLHTVDVRSAFVRSAAYSTALEKFADSAAIPCKLAFVRSADWKLAPLLWASVANVRPSRIVF